MNGRAFCGRELCNHEIGVLKEDGVFIKLQSYCYCTLLYVSTVSEHTQDRFTSVVVNSLVESDEPQVILIEENNGVDQVHSDMAANMPLKVESSK